jgi:cytidine deaminase
MLLRYRCFSLQQQKITTRFGRSTMAKQDSNGGLRSKLMAAARRAMKNAHAPYSEFKVGAALITTNGRIFVGCNVENASYGLTNCAERTAIFTAVAQLGPKMQIRAIAVANNQNAPCSPCGACRQVIYEFGPKAMIFFRGKSGGNLELPITDLLPEGFRLQ